MIILTHCVIFDSLLGLSSLADFEVFLDLFLRSP